MVRFKSACRFIGWATGSVALGLGLAGCPHPQTKPIKPMPLPPGLTAGAKAPTNAPHLHHFQPGDTWTYSIHSPDVESTATLTVLPEKVKAPDGKECFVVRTESVENGSPVSIERAYRQDASGSEILFGVPAHGGSRFRWGVAPQPSSVLIKSPLYPGEAWHNSIHLSDNSVQSVQSTIEKEDPITVPAGTFPHALLLHENQTAMTSLLDDHPKVRFIKIWLVPAVGFPVREMVNIPHGTEVQELLSYHVGPELAKYQG